MNVSAINFYPRPPRGGRPPKPSRTIRWALIFLSTPSARRATSKPRRVAFCGFISIHALREEGDLYITATPTTLSNISIHALREEGDIPALFNWFTDLRFLSTPSARRATVLGLTMPTMPIYFYPRPPRGGRHLSLSRCINTMRISIHALREEGDGGDLLHGPTFHDFYPRPPRGGRPNCFTLGQSGTRFLSTPSARRATSPASCGNSATRNFYPRPPRGGRLPEIVVCSDLAQFLSTPSARRAT